MAKEAAINLRQLHYFVKVVEAGNITHAAEQLHLAQTALGIQIRNLEDALQVKLLERHSRGVSTTEAGALLYERAIEVFEQIDAIEKEVIALGSHKKSTISLGATPSIMRLIGSELILDAREKLPNVALRVVEELSFVLVDALQRGEIDFALAYEIEALPGVKRTPLVEENLLHISAPGARPPGTEISLKDAVSGPLALTSTRDAVARTLQHVTSRLSIPLNVAIEVQSMQAIRTLVARGEVESIVPYGMALDGLETRAIEARRIIEPRLTRTLFLVTSARRGRMAHDAPFVAFLHSVAERLAEKIGQDARLVTEAS